MTNIQQHVETILKQIREYESRYHRTPGAVSLLAVSKGQSSTRMKAALAAGQLAFGENYLQEALTKMQELAQSNVNMSSIEWHFIGKIQSNKTKNIAAHFSWAHSVAEFNIAKRLSKQRPEHFQPLNICFEVNVSQEATKSGVRPDELLSLVKSCAVLPRLRLRGLMTIPAPAPTVTEQRVAFHTLHELWQQCRDQGFLFDTLSMGMSEDFEAAIAEGATIVRIGTALFGRRETCLISNLLSLKTGNHMKKSTIAIIGGGNMGASLLGGLIADGYPADHLWVSDPMQEKLTKLKQQFGVNTTTNNAEAVKVATTIIFAVKPQHLATTATDLASVVQTQKPLVLSIAAGIRETSLQHWLGGNIAIVRSMPNTPALIGSGASALYANSHVSAEQRNIAESILRAVGLVVWLQDEKLMDVVTALSGSGPAYFFLVMEILQKAAEQLGLPSDAARLLTLQTAFGAARMALESEHTLSELRQHVTSPGGTTEKALHVLEDKNIRHIFTEALNAANHRSEELADMLGSA